MSEHQHFTTPDTGVNATDLFIYESGQPGTGGLVSNITPSALPPRETIFVRTPELEISFRMDREHNTAEVQLTAKTPPLSIDRRVFYLTKEFQTKSKVPLTILFDQWKIVAVIDGEPLLVDHSGWVGVSLDETVELPAEYQSVLKEIADRPADVRTMWRYAIVLLMIHDEKARFVESHLDGETLHLVVQPLVGERFSLVRPPMSEEEEQSLLEQIRQLVGGNAVALTDSADGNGRDPGRVAEAEKA